MAKKSAIKKNETRIKKVGWPMEYLEGDLISYKNMPKKNIILFF